MEDSKIQWTDNTVNFWTGCTKVSEGCKYCYMYRDKERYGQNPKVVMRTSRQTFNAALKWKDPRKIFTNSWSDFFIKDADAWRNDAWEIIRRTPQHQWQILTKRPERIIECLPLDWGNGWDNVWLGVSIESQQYMHRIETLAKVPAKVRFISAEPLLGELDFTVIPKFSKKIDWVIIGGESGNNTGKYIYRECKEEWIRKIILDLEGTDVKVFVKQLGTHLANRLELKDKHGGDWDEWPNEFRIREYPSARESVFQKMANPLITLNRRLFLNL